jgi:hypothetical protein
MGTLGKQENEMKKIIKKLVLNRETVADLDGDLRLANGGATITCRPLACQYSGYQTCNTCQATCTTNYC